MFASVINQFQTMSFGEELHTIAFTVFIVGGAVCCFIRKDNPFVRLTIPARRSRRI